MILALDPAYRNTGVVVINKSEKIIYSDVISPVYEPTKDYNKIFGNLNYIYTRLERIMKDYTKIDRIYAESMSGSRSQRAAMLMGAVDALIIALARNFKRPLYMCNERVVKKILFGKRKVQKDTVIEWVRRKYNDFGKDEPKYRLEHMADSVAVYFAISKILGGEYEQYMQQLYIQG